MRMFRIASWVEMSRPANRVALSRIAPWVGLSRIAYATKLWDFWIASMSCDGISRRCERLHGVVRVASRHLACLLLEGERQAGGTHPWLSLPLIESFGYTEAFHRDSPSHPLRSHFEIVARALAPTHNTIMHRPQQNKEAPSRNARAFIRWRSPIRFAMFALLARGEAV